MHSEANNIDSAFSDFSRLISAAPYRFSGRWYVVQDKKGGYTAFRTKKAAANNMVAGTPAFMFAAN